VSNLVTNLQITEHLYKPSQEEAPFRIQLKIFIKFLKDRSTKVLELQYMIFRRGDHCKYVTLDVLIEIHSNFEKNLTYLFLSTGALTVLLVLV
jgi:hypothetical protein